MPSLARACIPHENWSPQSLTQAESMSTAIESSHPAFEEIVLLGLPLTTRRSGCCPPIPPSVSQAILSRTTVCYANCTSRNEMVLDLTPAPGHYGCPGLVAPALKLLRTTHRSHPPPTGSKDMFRKRRLSGSGISGDNPSQSRCERTRCLPWS